MVGAPKAIDYTYKTDENNDVGLVYKCMFKGPCKILKMDYESIFFLYIYYEIFSSLFYVNRKSSTKQLFKTIE